MLIALQFLSTVALLLLSVDADATVCAFISEKVRIWSSDVRGHVVASCILCGQY